VKEDLLPYFESELSFIRGLGKEFLANYGKVGQRLQMEPNKCEDPHVERLIESFALIAGRIHHKIDDEFPEITESLLNVLYPHYLRPIPSMSIAQFTVDPDQAQLSTGHIVEKDTDLYTRPVAGQGGACNFRTAYRVTLWPIEVTGAAVLPAATVAGVGGTQEAVAVIQIDLKCAPKIKLSSLGMDKLRFHLNGGGNVTYSLYELLFNNVGRAVLRSTSGSPAQVDLPKDCIQPVGFSRQEGMLPYPDRSFLGYRLLQEYFAFPTKFLFFDLCGFDQVERNRFGETFQILLFLKPFERKERLHQLEQNVNKDTFQLGCTPIVNLFKRLAEPVRITHTSTEYRIIPDLHRQTSTEVYSVDEVTSTAPYFEKPQVYEPFYSLRHAYYEDPAQAYWYASRRSSATRGDKGTEVYLTLVDLGFKPALPPVETLTVHVTCTNRDIAGGLPFTGEFGELSLESGSLVKARCIMAPSPTIRPPLRRGLQWRLISHLALNYLSIVQGGREALQEILKLYDFTEDPIIRKQIAGIIAVSSELAVERVVSEHGIVFGQGLRVNLKFNEDEFTGIGVFLFAAVLERFLGLYTAINSFTQLSISTAQRRGDLKQWPPRSGEQILL
jgi:type VI secretion system protein ImpG